MYSGHPAYYNLLRYPIFLDDDMSAGFPEASCHVLPPNMSILLVPDGASILPI